jgi:HEAT repeat protein
MGDEPTGNDYIARLVERWDALVRATSDDPPETFLQPPATEAEIVALERRLGRALPPSYRAFLAHSNGADAFPGWGSVSPESAGTRPTGLRAAATVDWIANGDRLTVAVWDPASAVGETGSPAEHPRYARQIAEREYLLSGPVAGGAEKVGHLRHVLEVSSCVDGYATYLNPLVVDVDGEWEAWDFGTKTLGASRHRSFQALLEADIAQMERRVATTAREDLDLDRQLRDIADSARSPEERIAAARGLFWRPGRQEIVVGPLSAIAMDQHLDLATRQQAMMVLGYAGTATAIATLAEVAADPEPRIRMTVAGPLAASSDPVAIAAARAMFADPATPSHAFSSVYRCSEAIWVAWLDSGDRRLIEPLANCGDERIVEVLVEAIVDPDLPDQERSHLISAAGRRLLDPRLVPALVAGAEFQIPQGRVHTAGSLERIGAIGEAIAMYRDAAIELGVQGWGLSEAALGRMTDRAAGDALLAVVAAKPTAAALAALGWHPSPAAVAAIEPLLDHPDLHLAAIDALEVMPILEASDSLARRSSGGDLLATRALARGRDGRALEPLLAMLADGDPGTSFQGADGLRDLRDPRATDALLAVADHVDPDIAVTAVHALISMASPRVPEALDRLDVSPDESARQLATRWRAGWANRS